MTTTTAKPFIEELRRINACEEAFERADKFDTAQEAWDGCERGDDMLWLCGQYSGEPESDARKKVVLVTCECVRPSLKFVTEGEERPRKAIEAAEDWARGGATTLAGVRAAGAAARAAAGDAAWAAARAAAWDAAWAAARAAARATAGAAAGDAAWAAARATAGDAAGDAALKASAAIVRKHYPVPPSEESA